MKTLKKTVSIFIILIFIIFILIAFPFIPVLFAAIGDTDWDGGGVGDDWSTSGNWTDGEPLITETAVIDTTPTALITSSGEVANFIYLPYSVGATGALDINSSGELDAFAVYVGREGTGYFTIDGGTLTLKNPNPASKSGAVLGVGFDTIGAGTGGSGYMTVDGGTIVINGSYYDAPWEESYGGRLEVGNLSSTGKGVFTATGQTSITVKGGNYNYGYGGYVIVGKSGTGEFTLNASTLTVEGGINSWYYGGVLEIGTNTGGDGTFTSKGGTIILEGNNKQSGHLFVGGYYGTGTMTIQGATIDIQGGNYTAYGYKGGRFYVGHWTDGTGYFTATIDSTITIGAHGAANYYAGGWLGVGSYYNATGEFSMTGGSLFMEAGPNPNEWGGGGRINVGSAYGSSGTFTATNVDIDLEAADHYDAIIFVGYDSGTGEFTVSGTTVLTIGGASLGYGGALLIGTDDGIGTFTINGASVIVEDDIASSDSYGVIVGDDGGTGTLTQNGGTLQTPILAVGMDGGTQGTVYLNTGTVTMEDSIKVGGDTGGTGIIYVGSSTGAPTITDGANDADLTVRVDSTSTGTLQGWGTVGLSGDLTNNGKIIAHNRSSGADRDLDLSSFSSVANTVENPTFGVGNGWYAESRGKLILPTLSVSASGGTESVNWGEAPADTTIDLVNSMLLDFHAPDGGTVDIALLADDHSSVPLGLPNLIGIWDIDSAMSFDTVDLTFRYDYELAETYGIEADLQIYHYVGGIWDPLTTVLNGAVKTAKATGITSLSLFGLAEEEAPETHSVASTDWSLGGTWDNGVPASGVNTFVEDHDDVTIVSDGETKSLTVESQGTLTIDAPVDLTLTVDGNLTITDTTAVPTVPAEVIHNRGNVVVEYDLLIATAVPLLSPGSNVTVEEVEVESTVKVPFPDPPLAPTIKRPYAMSEGVCCVPPIISDPPFIIKLPIESRTSPIIKFAGVPIGVAGPNTLTFPAVIVRLPVPS